MKRVVLISWLVFAVAVTGNTLRAQTPSGGEFQVNTYTTGSQYSAATAMDGNGNFVVVWQSYGQDGSVAGIRGRLFDSMGAPRTAEFAVNTYTTGPQSAPAVAMDGLGDFIVVWQSEGQDGSGRGVFGRRFDSTGAPLAGEFQVNSSTTDNQQYASVSADLNGNFVVVWQTTQGYYSQGIFGRRFTSTGAASGNDFAVNTSTAGSQAGPAVSVASAGGFMVVWSAYGQDGDGQGVFGRTFDSMGAATSGEVQVNQFTTGGQADPSIAADVPGNFVVLWDGQDGDGAGVLGRVFDGAGAALGNEFQVNTYTTGDAVGSKVALVGGNSFVVAWTSYYQDGSYSGVYAQAMNLAGAPIGNEFRVNTTTAGGQGVPSVGGDDSGRFVISWTSYPQDGSGTGVFIQRFGGTGGGGCMAGDTDADGVCDDMDNCPGLANPGQANSDADGRGDDCDIMMTSPLDGGEIDCSDPKTIRPTITWAPGFYDRFKVEISWDAGFVKGTVVSSGSTPIKLPMYVPPTKKLRKACAEAMAANPGMPTLFIRVTGKDRDVAASDPDKTTTSDVVEVDATP